MILILLVDKNDLNSIGDEILKTYPNAISDVEAIKNGNYLTKIDKYFKFFYKETSNLLDYISKNTIVFLDEPSRIAQKAQTIEYENKEIIEQYLDKNKITYDVKYDEDLVINGLGFVKIVNKGLIDVYIDKDVETFMRKSLI